MIITNKKLVQCQIFRRINSKLFRALKARRIYKFFHLIAMNLDQAIAFFPKRHLIKETEIDPNLIVFITCQGKYTCNPKAIAEELIRQELPYRLAWAVKGGKRVKSYPKELELVELDTYDFYRKVASAKVIIDNGNDLPRLGVHKKEGQYLIQTWHGSLGIRRTDVMNRKQKRLAKICQQETDYCISNSQFENEVYQSSFWKSVPVLAYGHARNDILFTRKQSSKNKIKRRVFKRLSIPLESHVLVYAPAKKNDENESVYKLDYKDIKNALEKRFGGEWIIVLRLHSSLNKKSKAMLKDAPAYVVNGTKYADIQELMLAADVWLTDYSSWIFDYILLKRPGFVLADKLDRLPAKSTFYYPLESTPFPIAANNKELIKCISDFDESKYSEDVNFFLRERGCIEDGHASIRIVEKVQELLAP